MSALATRAALFVALAAGALGCEQKYDRIPAASYAQVGIHPTAVGERIAIRIEPRDANGGSIAYDEHPVIAATCDVPGCTAELDPYWENQVTVSSPVAGEAHVTVTVNNDASVKIPVTIPFRKATKISLLRAPAESPSGTTLAMVPGDSQKWWVGVGDDAGPLYVPSSAIMAPRWSESSQSVSCSEASLTDTTGSGDWTTPIVCYLTSPVPTTLDVKLAYRGITREERVRFVPLAHVEKAEIVTCRGEERTESSDGETWTTPILVPAEQPAPCTPVDVVHYPARRDETFTVTARLVLDDGTVALGGSALLSFSGDSVAGIPSASTGTIVGRFGAAVLSVPYVKDP